VESTYETTGRLNSNDNIPLERTTAISKKENNDYIFANKVLEGYI